MPLFSMVHSSSSRMQRLIVCILTVNANCLMLLLFSVPTIDIGKDWGENYVFWEVFMFFCEMFEVLSYSLCTLAPNTVFFSFFFFLFVSFLVPLTWEIHTSLKNSLQIASEFSCDLDPEAGRIHKFHKMLVTND